MQALVKYLDKVSDEDIPSLEIPTGVPLIYELDDNLKPIRHYYVGYVPLLLHASAVLSMICVLLESLYTFGIHIYCWNPLLHNNARSIILLSLCHYPYF